ncbi:30S ribosomal protein S9 [Candidatus Peregrinibacteria bacterium]|jgi:small subunit ribosomal protein S9|nr:30S ribosomal protein S9 [Candidatus Peregrinibacteria bacterium]MBT7483611.1 30S ribosomal protein S9 [Candidatus Peregrinibacteria bacterium]MBT7702896.1 30S ribosomal protein S9 [Candidatus Peregrinibacteria bacterium]
MPKTEETVEAKGPTFNGKYHYASGKRKTSIARVRLYEKGQGRIVINGKPFKKYLTVKETYGIVQSPLNITSHLKTFDISVIVIGGGMHSQSEAVRHGIAKALVEFDPELRGTLKKAGFLTRDSRIKERKKYGLKRARRAPQFSKR